ncbi:class I SAM-dependent methyltransferase [Nocardioides cavernaquae]|uniref:class I SAM-dependent methyltransferase n=1 Tax=Nocardioides cavernaquae TaxID=2321396 RepID=UPI001600D3DE|nr:class I SAM-dependent methyltransferase [Nocardioides cavernaquae]
MGSKQALHVLRQLAYVGMAAAGVAAAVLAAAGSVRWAVAALSLVPVALAYLLWGFSRTLQETAHGQRERHQQLGRQVRRTNAGLSEVAKIVATLEKRQDPTPELSRAAGRYDELRRRILALTHSVDATASETVNLARLQDELLPGTATMPTLGGWAATNRTIAELVSIVLTRAEHPTVVECGSGSSTVWTAAALRKRGGGKVISLDHDASYAERTREELRRHGLSDYATVIHAPLTDLPGQVGRQWYSTAGLPELDGVDVLFVDGPPGASARLARQPAWDTFAPSLNNGALVILDDTDREAEQEIVEDWTSRPVAGRDLAFVGYLGRATLMDVTTG